MSFQLVELNPDVDEPVTLAEQKAWSKIDADYTYTDDQIELMISSARTLIEQQLNIGLVNRQVQLEWDGQFIDMPLSPNGAIESVKDKDGNDVSTDDYTVTNYTAKKIGINSIMHLDGSYWYSLAGFVEITPIQPICDLNAYYSCVYTTGYETIPKALKMAIMVQTDYMLKNYGDPLANQVSLDALRYCRGYSRNLPL